jgi:CHAD domain-containing protein
MLAGMHPAGDQAGDVAAKGVGEGLCAYAQSELRHACQFLSWRPPRLHAAVHHARKALRRVRATVAIGGKEFGPAGRAIDRELRGINRALSPLRDGQALVEVLQHMRRHCQAPEEEALMRRALRIAERRRAGLARNAPEGSAGTREQRLTLEIVFAALPTLAWSRLQDADVARALARSQRRLARAQARVLESGGDEARHDWRRRARRLSQQHRALGELVDAREREHAKERAERLGDLQDLSLLVEHCGKDSPFSKGDRWGLRLMAVRERDRLLAELAEREAK